MVSQTRFSLIVFDELDTQLARVYATDSRPESAIEIFGTLFARAAYDLRTGEISPATNYSDREARRGRAGLGEKKLTVGGKLDFTERT